MNPKLLWAAIGLSLIIGVASYHASHSTQVVHDVVHEGSATAQDISSNSLTVNGVTTWTLRQNMQAATTTLCYFPNPAGFATTTNSSGVAYPSGQPGMATSTLTGISVQITTGTSTDMTFDVSTSTSAFASSTRAFLYALSAPSGALFSGNWELGDVGTSSDARLTSSMPVAGGDQYQVRPAEFVTVKTAGAGLGGYTYSGQCIARFRSLNAI